MGESRRAPSPLPVTWRALVSLVKVLPLAGHVGIAVIWSFIVVRGVTPIVMSFVMANAVASGLGVARDGFEGQGDELLGWFQVFVALFALQSVVAVWGETALQWAGRRLNWQLREQLVDAATGPTGVRHLEDPDMVKAFQGAKDSASSVASAGFALGQMPGVVAPRLQVVGYLVGLVLVWWPAGVLLAALTVANQFAAASSTARVMGSSRVWLDLTFPNYQRDVAITPPAAKEVRVFGLGSWLAERYVRGVGAAKEAGDAGGRGPGEFTPGYLALLAANGVISAVAIVVLASEVRDGSLGVAGFTFAMAALNALRPDFNLADPLLSVAAGGLGRVAEAEAVAARASADEPPSEGRDAAGFPGSSIRFEHVTFRYPGTEIDILRDLNLELRAGERVALVGVNGAGKTTLVKLLGRLYEPTGGVITVDGVRLHQISPEAWRGQLAVLFQDFMHYDLPVRDNIQLGAVDLDSDDAAVLADAERAGAGEVMARLDTGLDTPLSPRFAGGTDLSGGEWQRIALARVLHGVRGGAQVLVLDEPTANLDVRAEAELYDRFLELTANGADNSKPLTTLVVSHRFSTVRQADRIVVLDDGRVAEEGTHDELLARAGRYAAMFRAQAQRFESATSTEPVR